MIVGVAVEIARNKYCFRGRRPNCKVEALLPIVGYRMRTKLFIQFEVFPCLEKRYIEFGKSRIRMNRLHLVCFQK